MTESNKLVLTAVIGILIGLVAGRIIWFKPVVNIDDAAGLEETATTTIDGERESFNFDAEDSEDPVASIGAVVLDNLSVAAGDQKEGKMASASVTTNKLVWVAVRDNNDGVMGKILGARRFGHGSAVVEIGLYRNTEAGRDYFVTLTDDKAGDMNYSADAVLKGVDGKPLMAVFTATK